VNLWLLNTYAMAEPLCLMERTSPNMIAMSMASRVIPR
jgi:hypothetical protein